MAFLYLAFHVLLNLVHRHMTRALDKRLYVLGPGTFHKLAHRVEFGKLGCIVDIVGRTWTQAVAQRDGYIILGADIADVIKVLVEETFLLMYLAPLGDNASASAHDTSKTSVCQMDILQSDAAVDGEIVHTLLTLLDKRIAEHFPC